MATSTYTPGTNDIVHKIDLDLVSRSRVVEPIHMVQNDKVLPVLAMSLYKEGTSYSCPSGSTVSIRLEKPDKKVVNIEVSGWDSSRHIVYMKTTYQMTSAFGKASALLEIDTGSGIAQTETFPIMIDRNPVQDGSIESTDEIKSLQGYVDAAAASANQAQTYRDTAGTYANSARTSATEANSARSQASGYATNAELAKTSAQNSASAAEDASDLSKSYAVGTNNTVRPGDKTDNAKSYSELAARLTDQATALLEEAERLLEQVNPEGAINPDTPITFQQATELANIQNEDSIRIALGKLSKLYASLDGKAAFYPVTTSRDISEVGTLMDGNTVADWIKELGENPDTVKVSKNLSSSGWYRFATKATIETTKDNYGGAGESGFIFISRNYVERNNESYIIAFCSSYGGKIECKCINASINQQLLKKIRVSLTPTKSFNIEMYYDSSKLNGVTVTMITNQAGVKWSSKNLEPVTETVSDIVVYDLPLKSDIIEVSNFTDIYTTVTTVANQYVDIPNSPTSYSYIPVITYKENTNLSNDFIAWVDTKWVAFSTVNHILYIHFYKYPI